MAYKGSQTQRSRIVGLSQAGNEAASDARLDNFIDRNQNLKDQSASVNSILQDMPKKNADFVRRQLEKTGGKRLRALLTLGSAKLAGYDSLGKRDVSLSACVELIHLSLIHI